LHDGQNQYNTGREVFAELKGREFYRTTGFKEIAIIYGDTEKSYRKTTQLINRIRHQEEEGTPSRTLHESTEREGTDLLDHIEEKSKCILEENGFSKDGICQERKRNTPMISSNSFKKVVYCLINNHNMLWLTQYSSINQANDRGNS